MNEKNIELEVIKVKAYSNNYFNDKIDELCKITHQDNSIIIFKDNNLRTMNIIPKWNNIIIEQKLRHFLKEKSKIKQFEKFYNLNHNGKYRKLEVNWNLTFENF